MVHLSDLVQHHEETIWMSKPNRIFNYKSLRSIAKHRDFLQ